MLDTDYENYMLVYTCQEINEYWEIESGGEISPDVAWNSATKKVSAEGNIEYDYPYLLLNVQPLYF